MTPSLTTFHFLTYLHTDFLKKTSTLCDTTKNQKVQKQQTGNTLSAWKHWFGGFVKNFVHKLLIPDFDKLLVIKRSEFALLQHF